MKRNQNTAKDVEAKLRSLSDAKKSVILQGFFKTAKGQYGEGDIFWGIVVPKQREVARQFPDLALGEIQKLLQNKIHEVRLTALMILVQQFESAEKIKNKTGEKTQKIVQEKLQKNIFDFYFQNTARINNWDLVDLSASKIVGNFLLDKKSGRKILYKMARSKKIWERRIAIISTHAFIKNDDFQDTLKIAEILLADEQDLIQKAVGWMLREVGKKSVAGEEELLTFLAEHSGKIPRTTLRYAIERFPEERRRVFFSAKKH
jgi:3-methyladenine DNA glycosylase AlkD